MCKRGNHQRNNSRKFLEVQDMSFLTRRMHRAPNMMIEILQHWKEKKKSYKCPERKNRWHTHKQESEKHHSSVVEAGRQ